MDQPSSEMTPQEKINGAEVVLRTTLQAARILKFNEHEMALIAQGFIEFEQRIKKDNQEVEQPKD